MWDWVVWGALTLAGVTTTGALALVAVRALRAWRDLRGTHRVLVRRLDELAAAGEATAAKVAAAGDTAALQESVGRLRLSLARLAVLRAAIDEAQETLGRITAVVPR